MLALDDNCSHSPANPYPRAINACVASSSESFGTVVADGEMGWMGSTLTSDASNKQGSRINRKGQILRVSVDKQRRVSSLLPRHLHIPHRLVVTIPLVSITHFDDLAEVIAKIRSIAACSFSRYYSFGRFIDQAT